MAEYHVGCGLAGIYAGTLKNKGEWKDKSEVTDEAIKAVVQYIKEELDCRGKTKFHVQYKFSDGTYVNLDIEKVNNDGKERK